MEADEITDAGTYEAMKKTGPANIVEAKFANGRYLARTENITALDGTAPKGVVIIAFDNIGKAKAYYENTKQATAMRMKGTKSRAFLVEVCLSPWPISKAHYQSGEAGFVPAEQIIKLIRALHIQNFLPPVMLAVFASHHQRAGNPDMPNFGKGSGRRKRFQRAVRSAPLPHCGTT
jgi:uncharacterized protein (DUF1330 family)